MGWEGALCLHLQRSQREDSGGRRWWGEGKGGGGAAKKLPWAFCLRERNPLKEPATLVPGGGVAGVGVAERREPGEEVEPRWRSFYVSSSKSHVSLFLSKN